VTVHDLQGKKVQPLHIGDAKAGVLFFLTPDCPISNSYAPETWQLGGPTPPARQASRQGKFGTFPGSPAGPRRTMHVSSPA
jgi:hypothetical protein